MRIGAFELREPLPELNNARAFATLSPWIDVGRTGSLALQTLEARFQAEGLGKLRQPGLFYDFTRYRPMVSLVEGRRVISIPNTSISYSRGPGKEDFIFLSCLEPHAMGEAYVGSVLKVLERLNVKGYCFIGGMYDSVPHTRPLLITGRASSRSQQGKLRRAGVKASGYQGPTTIHSLIAEQAPERGIETMTLIVHLPHYVQLEEDHSGHYALLNLICRLYNLPVDLEEIKSRGEKQYQEISLAVEADPAIAEVIQEMEKGYDEGLEETRTPERMPRLSPEVERFLKEMERRFDST